MLDDYLRLNEPDTRREVERRGGYFIAEGEHAIRALVATRDRWPIRSVLVTPAKREALADVLDGLDAPVHVEPIESLRAVAGFDVHRGALASAERGRTMTPADVLPATTPPRLVVVLEGLNDHENVGSIFRCAAAFGAGAVLLDPRTTDPLYRRCVRVSSGHVLRVPFARVAEHDWPGGLLADVRDRGYTTVALSPGAATALDAAPSPAGPVALLVGAEGPGLSAAASAEADHTVAIRMAEGVDSLNVAVAAAIAMHHYRAQSSTRSPS